MNKFTVSLLILASSIAINVYSQTVSIDNTFGQEGRTIIPNTSDIYFFDFDSYGNIFAVGYTLKGDVKSDLTIAKTNADGVIDENFGSNGIVKVTDYDRIFPIGTKITNDNKIVVIGSFTKVQFQGYQTIMMRFNENGTVDENFGVDGKVDLNFNTGDIISINCDNDDFMLIAKKDYQSENQYPHIVKYNYNGEIDETFGENGVVYLTNTIFPYSIKKLNNGSIIVAGTYNSWPYKELGICKLTPDGEFDADFSDNGIWHKNIMQDFDLDHEYFSNIFEDKEGNIVLSGSGLTNSLGWFNRAFLSKFSSNGTLDTSFGNNGFYCFDFVGSNKPIFQIGNKYITAGWNEGHDIISVNNDGSFGDDVYTCDIHYFQAMKLQGDNKIILGGGYITDNAHNVNFILERVIVDSENSANFKYSSSEDPIIYPNPTRDILYFGNETAFEIIDIQGRVLLNSTTHVKSVYVGGLAAGIYFVRLGNSVQKFIKK